MVTNSNGCTAIGTLTINVTNGFQPPTVSPNTPLKYCVGSPVPTFTATASPSTNSITWTFNSVSSAGTTFTPPQNLTPGTYPLVCVQGNGLDCLSPATTLNIVINPSCYKCQQRCNSLSGLQRSDQCYGRNIVCLDPFNCIEQSSNRQSSGGTGAYNELCSNCYGCELLS